MSILECKGIRKAFDGTDVLCGIDLAVEAGEFVTILGSSGCGKTTLLRIIGGLEEADSGSVLLEGRDVTDWEPNKRNVNTVFQNYALFPHLSVRENVAYPLKLRREPKAVVRQKTEEALALVRLTGLENRMPDALSGGQKQRVAIARAVVGEPKVLLLDEPLGALDLNLRRQMQIELKKLQKRLGITFIYITHDQEEALTMSDRIGVMRGGVLVQVGTPAEIYDSPVDSYTARFVGEANVLPAVVSRGTGVADSTAASFASSLPLIPVECLGERLAVRPPITRSPITRPPVTQPPETNSSHLANIDPFPPGSSAAVAVRGENLQLEKERRGPGEIRCVVEEKNFTGGLMRVTLRPVDCLYADCVITVNRYGIRADFEPGEEAWVRIPDGAAVLLWDGEESRPAQTDARALDSFSKDGGPEKEAGRE